MNFRRTPLRLSVARLAFAEELERALPAITADARSAKWRSGNDSTPAAARAEENLRAVELALEETYGPLPQMAGKSETDGFQFSRSIEETITFRARRARAIAERCTFIAARKPLRAFLPPEYESDGAVTRQTAAVLSAWREAWEQAEREGKGSALTSVAARRFDVSKPMVTLGLPTGEYRIYRGIFVPPDIDGQVMRIEMDEQLTRRGGAYRAERLDDSTVSLVPVARRISPFVIARTLIGANRAFAQEILRRLRAGVAASFERTERNCTRVVLPGGKRHPNERLLRARAAWLEAVADRHDAAVERLREGARARARAFAARPEVVEANARTRLARAQDAFDSARAAFNSCARESYYKADRAALPMAVPPTTYPLRLAALSNSGIRAIQRAEANFSSAWAELCEAQTVYMRLHPEMPDSPPALRIAEPMPPPSVSTENEADPARADDSVVRAGQQELQFA